VINIFIIKKRPLKIKKAEVLRPLLLSLNY
jgi:hypothetical protein